MKTYFKPGCDLSAYNPQLVKASFELLKKVYPDIEMYHKCCKIDPDIEKALFVLVCPGCDRHLARVYPVKHETRLLWEIIDQITDFPFPDYHGAEMTLQDPCNYRKNPFILDTVRSLLQKMNIHLIENQNSRENALCCGVPFYPEKPLEAAQEHIRQWIVTMPRQQVATYCLSCANGVYYGGKTPRYLLDLLFDHPTIIKETDYVKFRNKKILRG